MLRPGARGAARRRWRRRRRRWRRHWPGCGVGKPWRDRRAADGWRGRPPTRPIERQPLAIGHQPCLTESGLLVPQLASRRQRRGGVSHPSAGTRRPAPTCRRPTGRMRYRARLGAVRAHHLRSLLSTRRPAVPEGAGWCPAERVLLAAQPERVTSVLQVVQCRHAPSAGQRPAQGRPRTRRRHQADPALRLGRQSRR